MYNVRGIQQLNKFRNHDSICNGNTLVDYPYEVNLEGIRGQKHHNEFSKLNKRQSRINKEDSGCIDYELFRSFYGRDVDS